MKKSIRQSFAVPFHYEIFFTENVFASSNDLFAQLVKSPQIVKTFFVIDQGVADTHPALTAQIQAYADQHKDTFLLCGEPLVVSGGEQVKNDNKYVEKILEATHQWGIDRHAYIVAIGGGAVLDMAGFAAAIAHRGIRHIRIPTTVLSQNDSGVGVKNGINAYGKKNYLGTFAPPAAVINDAVFLTTLEDRDWRAGIAEAIKVALIKDAGFFAWLEEHAGQLSARAMEPMQYLIYRCAEMHLQHIAGSGETQSGQTTGDPFEMGSSRPLDFGHWAAHKLEQLTHYQIRHGEAVAIGMALDVTYSYLKGMISEESLKRVIQLISKLGFEVYVPALSKQELLLGLEEFREHLGGQLTIMLLEAIGKGKEVHEMDRSLVLSSVEKLKEF